MTATDTKRAVNAGAFFLILAIIGIALYFFMRRGGITFSSSPQNYTRNICEDAYQSEKHYEKTYEPYIDIPLKQGCFSGFVGLPDNWIEWQEQLLGNDPTDWAAEWWVDQSVPKGPYLQSQVKASGFPDITVGRKLVRLQGKGTLRIYRVRGYDNAMARAGDAPAASEKAAPAVADEPIPPPIYPESRNDQYDVVLEQCSRKGEDVRCWGFITNKTDMTVNTDMSGPTETDDEGFVFPGTTYGVGPSLTADLVPGVKTRYTVNYHEPHMNVKTITMSFHIRFGQTGNDFIFKDVAIK